MRTNRLGLITLALLSVFSPLCAPAAAESPDTFSDPAMSFTPAAGFKRVPMPAHDPRVFENKAAVAAYVRNAGTPDATTIVLEMDNFEGSAAAFALTTDNETRGAADGVFIKRSDTKLSNGMPAVWEEVTIGAGFAQIVVYRYLWADGVRGISLSETSRYGVLDENKAKADLAGVSAVAYPLHRY